MRRTNPHMKNKILGIAAPLFLKQGFENVDMRTIAREADIAVGTLYNYFPNKRVLFFQVFETGWEEVLDRINSLCTNEKTSQEKIRVFLKEFHGAVIERRGLGQELLRLSLESPEEKGRIRQVELRLKERLQDLLLETPVEEKFRRPLARCLISSTWSVTKEGPDQAENHFEFIDWLMENLIADKGEGKL